MPKTLRADYRSAHLYHQLAQARAFGSGFHMPGHGAGAAFAPELAANLLGLDLTELPLTEDLNHPGPCLEMAQAQVAKRWGAGHSYFVCTGSTTALKAALLLAPGEGGTLFLPRPSHQAVYHAASLLGLKCHFLPLLPPEEGSPEGAFAPLGQPDWPAWERLFADVPPGASVLVTSPDYYGQSLPLAPLSALVHRFGHHLLVDQAHGAALRWFKDAEPALQAGADLVVHSLHKTLPCLTPASLLHLGTDFLSARVALGHSPEALIARGQAALRLFQTSSPPLPVAASIDLCRAWLEEGEGVSALQATQAGIEALCARLQAQGISAQSPCPLRMVIDCAPWGTGQQTATYLLRQGLAVELADWRRLVLLFPFGVLEAKGAQLECALVACQTGAWTPEGPAWGPFGDVSHLLAADRALYRLLAAIPHPPGPWPAPPPSAWLSEAAYIPYPPGLPLLLPDSDFYRDFWTPSTSADWAQIAPYLDPPPRQTQGPMVYS